MGVLVEREAVGAIKSSKWCVSFNFVSFSHSKSTVWHDVAVVLNSVNCVEETIFLCKVSWYEVLQGVFFRTWCQWISFLLLLFFFGWCFPFFSVSLNWDVDMCTVSLETTLNAIVLILVLGIEWAELFELEVLGCGPEESFRWELVLLLVGHSHSNIVVELCSLNFPPEEKFFEIFCLWTVQESLQCHLELKSTNSQC